MTNERVQLVLTRTAVLVETVMTADDPTCLPNVRTCGFLWLSARDDFRCMTPAAGRLPGPAPPSAAAAAAAAAAPLCVD